MLLFAHVIARRGQTIVGAEDYKDLCWKDVDRNIGFMDRTYDASFGKWVKCEDNIDVTATHMKRLTADIEAKIVINGLRWLISDWTLGSITRFVKLMFTNDFWIISETPVLEEAKLDVSASSVPAFTAQSTSRGPPSPQRRDSTMHVPGHSSISSVAQQRRRSSTAMQGSHHPLCSRKRNSFHEPQDDSNVGTSAMDMDPLSSPSSPRRRRSSMFSTESESNQAIRQARASASSPFHATPSGLATKSSTTSPKPFWFNGHYYKHGEQELLRRVAIIRGMTDGWAIHYVADLVGSILATSMTSPAQRHYFVEQFAAGWSFHQLSEFLLYLGPQLAWESKVVMLKAFSAASYTPNHMHNAMEPVSMTNTFNPVHVQQGGAGFYQHMNQGSLNLHEQANTARATEDVCMTHGEDAEDVLMPLRCNQYCSCGAPLLHDLPEAMQQTEEKNDEPMMAPFPRIPTGRPLSYAAAATTSSSASASTSSQEPQQCVHVASEKRRSSAHRHGQAITRRY